MGQRILSVDDNEVVGWTLAARLWVAGYDVESVSSAEAAIEALKDNQYDLVLMDLEMPVCGGLDALETIKQQNLGAGVPIVLLTASDHFGHVQKAYALGASGYLTKGFAATKLVKSIDRLMKGGDVIWIDDLHCVSKQRSLDDSPATSANPALASPAAAARRPSSAARLTLVSTCHDSQTRTLGAC